MSWSEQLPVWHPTGDEPSEQKKTDGWQPEEKPPAGWFNWLFNRIYKCIVEIRSAFDTYKGTKVADVGVDGELHGLRIGQDNQLYFWNGSEYRSVREYADSITLTNRTENESGHLIFTGTTGTGNLPVYTNANIRVNPSNGNITTNGLVTGSAFVGDHRITDIGDDPDWSGVVYKLIVENGVLKIQVVSA